MSKLTFTPTVPAFSRRQFVQGLTGSTLLLPFARQLAWAADAKSPAVLSGSEFDLSIGETRVNYTGASRVATVVNGQVPAPLLKWREGDVVTVRVHNTLDMPTSIHWHGIIVPADMDGVPGISFHGIAPRSSFAYRFKVNQSGTYWYHAHSRFQEQTGLYGPILIEPRRGERHRVDRDYFVLLSDWTDLDPEHIYRTLKRQSDYFDFGRQTVGDFMRDARERGVKRALDERRMWNQMRMRPSDLADVSSYGYTYLMNGLTPNGNWWGEARKGERVRLRFVNGSSMSTFDVRIPGLKLTMVAADGQDIEPVSVDEFRISSAETYDAIVEINEDRAYTIFAQTIDRSGYARGTLAPRADLQAEVPPLDPRPLLSMTDMGMSHGARSHAAATANAGAEHAHHTSSAAQTHPASEAAPIVDMQATQPQMRLGDPGVGLRDNGRRVLTYADLHTLGGPIDRRDAGREIELHLTGHMERFIWSFNGQKFSDAEPLRFIYGERLRIVLVNDSMMTHPIHLHGMWSEIENEHGEFVVRKHTVMVQPGQKVAYAVTADALGRWAYHCHLLYHMEAGMFREVVVAKEGA